jgi:hypothetical protein
MKGHWLHIGAWNRIPEIELCEHIAHFGHKNNTEIWSAFNTVGIDIFT